MDFKHFLKPNTAKIILSLFLLFLWAGLELGNYCEGSACQQARTLNPWYKSKIQMALDWPIMLPNYLNILFPNNFFSLFITNISQVFLLGFVVRVLGFLLFISYLYVISCGIVLIINKIRKAFSALS